MNTRSRVSLVKGAFPESSGMCLVCLKMESHKLEMGHLESSIYKKE